MIRNNYHTHTFRCGHAIGNDEEYVIEAIGMGLHTLGFSDHVMLKGIRQDNVRGDFECTEGYFASIRQLQYKYRDRIKILLGFEAEAFEEFFPYYKELLETKKIDYLILGNHCTLDNGIIRNYFGKFTTKKDVIEYTDSLIKGMETGLFSAVAHPDYFMDTYFKWNFFTKRIAKRIIKKSIELDIPLEFNLSCFRRGKQKKGKEIRWGYPYIPFWKMVSKMKAKVIVGIDAHAPSDISSYLNDEGYRLLETLNLNVIEELNIDRKYK